MKNKTITKSIKTVIKFGMDIYSGMHFTKVK